MTIATIFGIFGYLLEKHGYPLAPIALAIVLGNLAESNFRTALIRSNGNPLIFISSPISIFFLAIAVCSVIITLRKERGLGKER